MEKLSGSCLCGGVSYAASADIMFQANCHCTDCQQSSGSPFATLVFIASEALQITGATKEFAHQVDSGSTLVKQFCPNCGSQLFSANTARSGMIGIKAGTLSQRDLVKPQVNVFISSKMKCTILDSDLPAFDKMPPSQ